MANLKNSDAETKAVEREILKNRGSDLPLPMPDFGNTYEEAEARRVDSLDVLMHVLKDNPNISVEGLAIARRMVQAVYSDEDAARIAAESLGNNLNEF